MGKKINKKGLKACTTIEIEDYYGSTIGAFIINKKIDSEDLVFPKNGVGHKNFDVADEDNDYIFEKCNNLIRVQHNEKWMDLKKL